MHKFLASLLLALVSGCYDGPANVSEPEGSVSHPGINQDRDETPSMLTPRPNMSQPLQQDAGMTLSHFLAGLGLEDVVANSHYDVIVATIQLVTDGESTNGSPPIVALDVDEVLRGDQQKQRQNIVAIWAPFPHDIDHGADDQPEIERWRAEKLAGPSSGTKLILLGEWQADGESNDRFWVSPVGRFAFSDQSRAAAMAGIKTRTRGSRTRGNRRSGKGVTVCQAKSVAIAIRRR